MGRFQHLSPSTECVLTDQLRKLKLIIKGNGMAAIYWENVLHPNGTFQDT